MRALLVTAFFTAGCLHAQGPGKGTVKTAPATLHAFDLLVNDADTIVEAWAFAEAKGLSREERNDRAERAYWSFMHAGVYAPAAEIASRFGFPERAVGLPLEASRREYEDAAAKYVRGKDEKGGLALLHAAMWKLRIEIRIACRYAPEQEAKKTVSRAVALKAMAYSEGVVYPLLDEECPVSAELRDEIIQSALMEDKNDYAIRHAAAANWDDVKTSQFLWHFFYYGNCTYGLKALAAFKVEKKSAENFIENANCEDSIIDSRGWTLEVGTANGYFFAAVRGKKYNLAFELLPFSAHGENGQVFLFQEAVRGGNEHLVVKALKIHVSQHDAFMAYLWDRGRYRFIANFSLTMQWQQKAFDKLLELKKWEDAAEAAEYGCSETLRTGGVKTAFRAAMAAGDFKAGRYFVYRYGPVKDKPGLITQAMYDEEKDKFYAALQASGDPKWMKEPTAKPTKAKKRRKHKPKRKAPCPEGDWCP